VPENEWWRLLLRLFYAPGAVFAELSDESREAADARQEPLVAITFLAGIAMFIGIVALEPPYGRFHYDFSAFNLVFESILGGALVAGSNFWLGGALVYLGARGFGATTGYRLARHVAGLATTPFVILLVFALPVRLGLYGTDLFKAGGGDDGSGGAVFVAIDAVALAWTLVLVVIGIRQTQRWSWIRALGALGIVALFSILFGTLAFAASR
jgi:Yip1-like protein